MTTYMLIIAQQMSLVNILQKVFLYFVHFLVIFDIDSITFHGYNSNIDLYSKKITLGD